MAEFHIKTLLLRTGERLPVLIDGDGMPLYGATVFAVAEVRNRSRSCSTIANALGALAILHSFMSANGVDIEARLDECRLLEIGEIERLVRACSVESSPSTDHRRRVSPAVCASRLRTIRNYLHWLAKARLFSGRCKEPSRLQRISELTSETINSRIPPTVDNPDAREGLEAQVVAEVAAIIRPDSKANPWKDAHVKVRNRLIWNLLEHLGPRRGELLGLRISNINLRKGTITIVRQADSPHDPRRYQPNTKTLGRELDISEALQRQVAEYIFEYRARLLRARKHDFLLVANNGNPMSLSTINKVFKVLRVKNPSLPTDLTPHVLRHTWNDRFSEEVDRRKVDSNLEKELRSYQMGWKYTSKAAGVYTRRFVRRKAQEVSIGLQKRLLEGSKG